MNRFRIFSICLWASAAVAVARAEQAKPLEESRKELKKLEAGPAATGAPTAQETLKGVVMPALQTPAASASDFHQLTPRQSERERQQRNDAQRNWLLNGMNQLQKESEEKGQLPGGAGPESGSGDLPPDPSDPAYLLKLYEKQKKSGQTKAADAKTLRAPQADPFAPFLQGWLAGSPLKDQVLSESSRARGESGKETGTETGSSTDLTGGRVASMISNGGARAATQASDNPNPYLAGSGVSAMGSPVDLHRPAPSTGLPAPTAIAPVASPVRSGIAREAAPAANDRKPPPPPLADEKKYFPQLKKF